MPRLRLEEVRVEACEQATLIRVEACKSASSAPMEPVMQAAPVFFSSWLNQAAQLSYQFLASTQPHLRSDTFFWHAADSALPEKMLAAYRPPSLRLHRTLLESGLGRLLRSCTSAARLDSQQLCKAAHALCRAGPSSSRVCFGTMHYGSLARSRHAAMTG